MSITSNVNNNFNRPFNLQRDNVFNLSQGQWTINGVPVIASAAQLNGTSPIFGNIKIIEKLEDFPEPNINNQIVLEEGILYFIAKSIDLGQNYFFIGPDVFCQIQCTPGATITSSTTYALFTGSGFTTLILTYVFVNVPNGSVFYISGSNNGGIGWQTLVCGDVKAIGLINGCFTVFGNDLVIAGDNLLYGLKISNCLTVGIDETLNFNSSAEYPLFVLDGDNYIVRISGMSGIVGNSGAWVFIEPTAQFLLGCEFSNNPYFYNTGTFFWIGQTGAIQQIDNSGPNVLVTTEQPHGLSGTFYAMLESNEDYSGYAIEATVVGPSQFTTTQIFTAPASGGKWTAVAYSYIDSFSNAGGGLTTVTTPRDHQQSGTFSVAISGDTIYSGTYLATVTGSNTFTIDHVFSVNDAGPNTSWDATSQANENPSIVLTGNGQLPDSPPKVQYAEVVANFDQISTSSNTLALTPNISRRISTSLDNLKINGGPNFSGGDRDIRILGIGSTPNITTIDSTVLGAIAGNPSILGSADLPLLTLNSSNNGLSAQYFGGTTDYTAGKIIFYVSYIPQVNKLGA